MLVRAIVCLSVGFVYTTHVVAAPPEAGAEGVCVQSGFGVSQFDGHGAYNSNGNDGSPYRGVVGDISTRIGYSCDVPSGPPSWYKSAYNFTTSWVMLANPDGASGYAQAGYFRYDAGAITSYAEFNPDGGATDYTRIFPAVLSVGTTHRYKVDLTAGCVDGGVSHTCLDMYVDGTVELHTSFDPITQWGHGQWAVETYGEVKDAYSDMPGAYGSSCFFSGFGTKTSTQNYVGWIGWNANRNDNSSRWALGATNEFPVGTYGYNFQIYTY